MRGGGQTVSSSSYGKLQGPLKYNQAVKSMLPKYSVTAKKYMLNTSIHLLLSFLFLPVFLLILRVFTNNIVSLRYIHIA